MKKGDYVKETEYGHEGIINEVYDNWQDLKRKCHFVTIDPNPQEMDHIERLINGDPKDDWLTQQNIPFTEDQLGEKWFSVLTLGGGSIWSCKSRLKLSNNL